MEEVYQRLREALPGILRQSGATSAFEARVFRDLVVFARRLSDRYF